MSASMERGADPAMPSGAAMVELRGISRRFGKTLDFAARLARRLGAPVREDIVHAVDGVDLTIRKGEAWGAPGPLPEAGRLVRSDAAARRLVEPAWLAGDALPVLGLLDGDLCRTLGGQGDEARLRSARLGTPLNSRTQNFPQPVVFSVW